MYVTFKFIGIFREKYGEEQQVTLSTDTNNLREILLHEFNIQKDINYICLIDNVIQDEKYCPQNGDFIVVVPMVAGG